jgi:hypothetical protein
MLARATRSLLPRAAALRLPAATRSYHEVPPVCAACCEPTVQTFCSQPGLGPFGLLCRTLCTRGCEGAQKVIDHYENPRNVGSMDKNDSSVGSGEWMSSVGLARTRAHCPCTQSQAMRPPLVAQ